MTVPLRCVNYCVTVKFLVAVPPVVVTTTGPVVAPAGTRAFTFELEMTVKSARIPLNVTPDVVLSLDPLIAIVVPTGAL